MLARWKENSLRKKGYNDLEFTVALKRLRLLFVDIDTVVSNPEDLNRGFGIQTYGHSLLEVLRGQLDHEYVDLKLELVNGKILWVHGGQKEQVEDGWQYFS